MANSQGTAVKEIPDLTGDQTVPGRELLATAIAELYGDQGANLNERERGIMHGILDRLIRDVEKTVRTALSARLARQPNVSRRVITALANDEIDVARPVLIHSPLLSDKDLIDIVRTRTLEHQLAITASASLSEGVSDALAATGNTDVIRSLLENQNASLSAKTMAHRPR